MLVVAEALAEAGVVVVKTRVAAPALLVSVKVEGAATPAAAVVTL